MGCSGFGKGLFSGWRCLPRSQAETGTPCAGVLHYGVKLVVSVQPTADERDNRRFSWRTRRLPEKQKAVSPSYCSPVAHACANHCTCLRECSLVRRSLLCVGCCALFVVPCLLVCVASSLSLPSLRFFFVASRVATKGGAHSSVLPHILIQRGPPNDGVCGAL